MNYIGSKQRLLPEIKKILKQYRVPQTGRVLDLFTGTGAVSKLFKQMGYHTTANDWQYYAYLLATSYLMRNGFPCFLGLQASAEWPLILETPPTTIPICAFDEIGEIEPLAPHKLVLSYLNCLPGKTGSFVNAYCESGDAGRLYFSHKNGKRIQDIRDKITDWRNQQLVSSFEACWLVSCLLESADRVSNTASVYGAYLKKIKKTAQKDLKMVAIKPVASETPAYKHNVFCDDGAELLKKLSGEFLMTYLDPPYNHRQYSANYHLLETIACWDSDRFSPKGVTGLRETSGQKSEFCGKLSAESAFENLLDDVASPYLLFSYNNEGIVSEEALRKLLSDRFSTVNFHKVSYPRFRSDNDSLNRKYKADSTKEFLILCKR